MANSLFIFLIDFGSKANTLVSMRPEKQAGKALKARRNFSVSAMHPAICCGML